MNLILSILLHIIIYAFPIFLSVIFSPKFQIYFSYAYMGVIFCLTKIFNTLYNLKLSDEFFINGGDMAYSALLFAVIFLILNHPEPEISRNLIYFIFILNLFISFMFLLLNHIFTSAQNVVFLDFSEIITEFSFKSVFYSFILISGELILQLVILRLFLKKIKNQYVISVIIGLVYYIVLIIDGILYPAGINLLIPEKNYSILYGIMGKVIFGGGFGLMIILYLNLFPSKLKNFTETHDSLIRYLLPPKRKSLVKKYEEAKAEIVELRKILPICSKCKKIRDDEGYWTQLEEYLAKYKDVYFSHSYCPTCAKEIMDEIDNNQ